MANRTANQRQRNNERTSDKASFQDPNVAHWINECPNEEYRNGYVPERQPVGAISNPRVSAIHLLESVADGEQPSVKAVGGSCRAHPVKTANRRYKLKFPLKRKRS